MHLLLPISVRAFLYGLIHEDAGTTFLFIKMLCLTPPTRHLKFVNISPFSKYYGRYGNFYLLLCLAIGGGGGGLFQTFSEAVGFSCLLSY